MHGTVEWLPGSPLGNTGLSWSEQLLGAMPNVYVYAANNPSESIIAKRRGYGVIISHNVPPYGRAGLYKQTAQLRELLNEYRENPLENVSLRTSIFDMVNAAGLDSDCPYVDEKSGDKPKMTPELAEELSQEAFDSYASQLYTYLGVLENRLFSEGLHSFGKAPTQENMVQYLNAYFDGDVEEGIIDDIVKADPTETLETTKARLEQTYNLSLPVDAQDALQSEGATSVVGDKVTEAREIRNLLALNSEEIHGYIARWTVNGCHQRSVEICFETVRGFFRLAETFTRSIRIACLRKPRRLVVPPSQTPFSNNIKKPTTASIQNL